MIIKILGFSRGNKNIDFNIMINEIFDTSNYVLNNSETFTLILIQKINRFTISKNSHKKVFNRFSMVKNMFSDLRSRTGFFNMKEGILL